MTDDRLLRSVQRLSSALGRLERQTAAQSGVSVSQLRVLLYLHEAQAKPIRISDLAEDQGLAVSTMTRNLALLEKKGWLERRPGAEDRRTVLVALTPAGQDVATELQKTSLGQLSQVFRAFEPTDIDARASDFDRVASVLENPDDA